MPATNAPPLLGTPRLGGNPQEDAELIRNWMDHLFRSFDPRVRDYIGERIGEAEGAFRASAQSSLTVLDQPISDPPTQAEVAAIQAKVNEVILFLAGSAGGA